MRRDNHDSDIMNVYNDIKSIYNDLSVLLVSLFFMCFCNGE